MRACNDPTMVRKTVAVLFQSFRSPAEENLSCSVKLQDTFVYARLKNERICRGDVRLSVRPSFPDFFQHALRYQFETWLYMHSVVGTTCRV